jgi:hypothetical protein
MAGVDSHPRYFLAQQSKHPMMTADGNRVHPGRLNHLVTRSKEMAGCCLSEARHGFHSER